MAAEEQRPLALPSSAWTGSGTARQSGPPPASGPPDTHGGRVRRPGPRTSRFRAAARASSACEAAQFGDSDPRRCRTLRARRLVVSRPSPPARESQVGVTSARASRYSTWASSGLNSALVPYGLARVPVTSRCCRHAAGVVPVGCWVRRLGCGSRAIPGGLLLHHRRPGHRSELDWTSRRLARSRPV